MFLLSSLLDLFYPRLCAACNETLYRNETFLCTSCLYNLPRTNFHNEVENEVAKIFWGRVPIQYATAFYHFQKEGLVQNMIHKLKYKGQKEIGSQLGKIIGKELSQSVFKDIDIIIPVPLHKTKLRKRGYNQSECIAAGISETMNKPMDTSTLYRSKANATQTRKQRFDRWSNVEGIFALKNKDSIANKHILIVDDVVTTGATLEACATTLLQAEKIKISIVTLAFA